MRGRQRIRQIWVAAAAAALGIFLIPGLNDVLQRAAAQDAAVQVKDGRVKPGPGMTPQTDGRDPTGNTVRLSLKLYDGASGDPFLSARRAVQKGINAFDALRATVSVEFATFAPNLSSTPPVPGGPFVNALARVPSAPPRYRMLYVDGKLSDVGIGAIKINEPPTLG